MRLFLFIAFLISCAVSIEDKYDFIPLSIDEGYFISYKTGERTDVKVSDVVEEFKQKFLK
jgi:hypothetical protein